MDFKILYLLGVLKLFIVFVKSQNRVIQTSLGAIRGRIATHEDGVVQQFLGIRYAKAPTGDRRFSKPIAVDSWDGELDATQYRSSCPQIFPFNTLVKLPNRNINEDCLMLNIYKPLNNGNGKKAVMVYIHGGGFNSGQGMALDGSLLALKGDVIVITFNYRLDVLGFMSTGDSSAPGNYGLWDQLLALQWIQDHISSFEGDSNRVTLFGVSAGAMSIGLHLFSTHSKGLFHRAILQSGSPFTNLAFAFDPVNYSKNISVELGCAFNEKEWDTKAVVDCLKSADYNDILGASVKARTHNRIAYRLDIAPVVDNDFISDLPDNIVGKGNADIPFYTTDVILGSNTAEGGNVLFMLNNLKDDISVDIRQGVPNQVLCNNVSKYLVQDFFNNNKNILKKICNMYSVEGEDLSIDEHSMKVVNMVGDMMFVEPAVQTLHYHSKLAQDSSTYQYVFSHQPKINNLKTFFPWFKGSNHLDEIPFVFGPMISYSVTDRQNIGEVELQLSNKIMIYWTNFAKTGNPNQNEDVAVSWPLYTLENKEYLNISETMSTGENLWPSRMSFWDKLSTLTVKNEKKEVMNSDNSCQIIVLSKLFLLLLIVAQIF